MNAHKVLVLTFFILVFFKVSGQDVPNSESNSNSIYTVFDNFFEDEIKKQGVKRNWIFKLKEIYGFHKFDYNKDGYQDVCLEFSAVQEETEGVPLYFTVLFKNVANNTFVLVNYLDSADIHFVRFEENKFYFRSNQGKTASIVYKLDNSNFIKL